MSQTPRCPLCGSENNELTFSTKSYDLLVCNTCELLFINPYPSDIKKRHTIVAESSFEQTKILNASKHYSAEVGYYKKYFPLIEHECKDARSVLDVGCGTGHLLERLSKYSNLFRVGIELDSARAKLAMKYSGCKIYQIPIEKFTSEVKFDVITMINVLSHIPSLDQLFSSITSLLSEKGKLIIKIGEFPKDVKKGNVFDWGIPAHMHFVGLNTLDFICKKYGFTILKHQRILLSEDIYTRERFKSPGGSFLRNMIKLAFAYTPFALSLLKKSHDLRHRQKLYSSFIVLALR